MATFSRIRRVSLIFFTCLSVCACAYARRPLEPYSADTPPLALLPATQAGIEDKRARFREIFCEVLEARSSELPDYQPCEQALTRLGVEPPSMGRPVTLELSRRRLVAALVPGIGWDCFSAWLQQPETETSHVRKYGYDFMMLTVDALSGTQTNAGLIRDAIMAMPQEAGPPRLVLIGHSKGVPDILEALVTYPELRSRVAAVVSNAGAVGGSPLANDAEQYQAELLRHLPKSRCGSGDGRGVASLRPATRRAWLATHRLPSEVRYYSLVAFPQPDRISAILKPSYNTLSRVDPRNDSHVLFYDQLLPGSTLLGYLNADHWAIAVPIARAYPMVGAMFVTRNAYPREALLEAILRFVEEDLQVPN